MSDPSSRNVLITAEFRANNMYADADLNGMTPEEMVLSIVEDEGLMGVADLIRIVKVEVL